MPKVSGLSTMKPNLTGIFEANFTDALGGLHMPEWL